MARSRAYRWSEEGIDGISDKQQILKGGKGIGASHQTGWTGLIAMLL